MSVEMLVTKPMKYRTRRLLPGETLRVKSHAEAKVLEHLRKARRTANPNSRVALDDEREKVGLTPISKATDDIKPLRDAYMEKFGKRAFNGWGADELKRRLAE